MFDKFDLNKFYGDTIGLQDYAFLPSKKEQVLFPCSQKETNLFMKKLPDQQCDSKVQMDYACRITLLEFSLK